MSFQRRHELGIRDPSCATGTTFELGEILLRNEQEGVALENPIGDCAPWERSSAIAAVQSQDADAQMTVGGSHEAHKIRNRLPTADNRTAFRTVTDRTLPSRH